MTSSLVSQIYGELSNEQELPSNYLIGSLTSSICRLKDAAKVEGGFFVFDDLSVTRPGCFRLHFSLYERDQRSSTPRFNYVSGLVTNLFTIFKNRIFRGLTGSTALTRTFSEQGVKVRLRQAPRRQSNRSFLLFGHADNTEPAHKPVDQAPIVQLPDKRDDGKSVPYNSKSRFPFYIINQPRRNAHCDTV